MESPESRPLDPDNPADARQTAFEDILDTIWRCEWWEWHVQPAIDRLEGGAVNTSALR